MKKGVLSAAFICFTALINAQVSFSVISPASISGGYDFTSNGDGTDWGLADLNDPNDAVLDTLVLVDDGTPGINAQGIPFANEGCAALTPGSLTGKIAVVYRYDGVSPNVCWYGTKVLNAQNAGAIGVVMINREDALIDVPGTTDGPNTSIPFAFISKSDGAILRAKMDAGEDVVAFIGNKTGLFANDLGMTKESTEAPKISVAPLLTAQNGTEFTFDMGTTVYNYGSLDQTGVTITANVTGPGATWSQSSGPHTLLVGDTIDVFTGGTYNLPAFSLASYNEGRYRLTYSVTQDSVDQLDFDNTIGYDFILSDSMIAYCNLDTLTGMPVANAYYRPANSPTSFEMCLSYQNPNASRIAASGLYFTAVTGYDSGVSLEGEEIALKLYQWNDVFTDLNDPNLDFSDLNAVAFGFYYYPSDLQYEVVYGEFTNPVQLIDNQRYLACVQPNNDQIFLGHDASIDYTRSIDNTLQPISPNNSDNGYFALGFGTDLTPALAMKTFDAALVSLSEVTTDKVKAYPNPTDQIITFQLDAAATGSIRIFNLMGSLVMEAPLNGDAIRTLDVSQLESGMYTVEIETDQIQRTEFVKIK